MPLGKGKTYPPTAFNQEMARYKPSSPRRSEVSTYSFDILRDRVCEATTVTSFAAYSSGCFVMQYGVRFEPRGVPWILEGGMYTLNEMSTLDGDDETLHDSRTDYLCPLHRTGK